MSSPKDKETNFGWRPFFQEGSSIAEKFPPNPPADHERDHETGADTLPAQPDNPKDASLKVVALELEEPGPTWVNLFYDLAWTATFASLTQWGNLSYVVFFTVVWWLWTWYHTHFYVNDWFHLVCIFLQLIVFGMLAATTRDVLDPQTTDQMTDPNRYQAERMAKLSIKVIGISLASSRVVLLIQYLRVIVSGVTSNKIAARAIRRKVCTIAAGLSISTILFFSAWGFYRGPYGRTATRAGIKYVLWGLGLAGINGIAGTLYSVIWAPGPGLEGPIVYNVGCAALIITFIAYLYFESPTDTDISGLEDNRRSGYWMFCHLPLLLSIILLLIGVKKQFSLSCILSTATTMFQVVEEAINDEQLRLNYISAQTNMTIKNYLLRRGIVWQDEYDQLVARLTNGYTLDLTWSDEQKTEFYAWNYRISLKILVSTFNVGSL
ncbi:Bacterial low temperature requirement A protein (LtrA), partial [Rhizoctonia solani]